MISIWTDGLHSHIRKRQWFKLSTTAKLFESQASLPLTEQAKAHSASDYDQQFEVAIIGQINFRNPPKANPDKPTIITIDFIREKERNLLFATGADTLPPLLSPCLQAGISKLNMCDASIHLLFDHIQHALFAADSTIEQFGFKPDMWFQTQGEYLDKCTCDNKHKTADMNERTKRDERCGVGMDRVVQSLCNDFDMVEWKGLDSELRVGWSEQIVRQLSYSCYNLPPTSRESASGINKLAKEKAEQ
ncbi:hypothetical protein HBI04_184150 [Parastagonospora nodorum]|nr:hypothetical protein HBI04_184150 [Parastagonospora nodorum]KAH4991950.1 hypothetical protein HBI77_210530 [Parastagonospora nodorum]KAH5206920.1 hypothetical protein HBH77_093670 [Parastagonospora nodorum]KAH5467383.1 hypothetical protein HBI28_200840 [Parastagonospora nodorum]KAH5487838.1 hypothetical protein HBI29_213810 [Parastagonospora nodorum]